jgi:hypothetical protein
MKCRFEVTLATNMCRHYAAKMANQVGHAMWYTILDWLGMLQHSGELVAIEVLHSWFKNEQWQI